MYTKEILLGTMLLVTSCKREEECRVKEQTGQMTHTTRLLGQVNLSDSVLCADVIMTSLCSGGVCTQHVNLIDSPCVDTIEITSPRNESVK